MAAPVPTAAAPERRRLWPLWAAVTLLLAFTGYVGLRTYRALRGPSRLDEVLAELDRDDPGWRLEGLEAARAQVPEAENSARRVVAAAGLLPQNWPAFELTGAFDDLNPPELLDDGREAELARELDGVGPALKEARALADLPRGRHAIAYAPNVLATRLDHAQQARHVAALLHYDALRRAQAGDNKGALRSCRAALNAGRSLGDEPMSISQLIRMACAQVAGQALERVLAQGEADPDELAALQRLFADEARHPVMRIVVRGERAFAHSLLEGTASGRVDVKEMGTGWNVRRKVREEHPLLLTALTRRAEAADRPLHEQAEADEEFAREVGARPDSSPTKLLAPSIGRLTNSAQRHQALARCMAALLAVERHRLKHGAWPEALEALVPAFLPAAPLDPYDGKPLRYRRWAEGVVVYSVGEDRRDDGGQVDFKDLVRPAADLGYRLWEPAHRRRPPRPAPPPDDGPP